MKFILSLLIFAMPTAAFAQSKFFATSSRGGAEGAKQNAMLQTLIQENAARMAEAAANAASITTLRDATEASLTTISECGAQGTLFGPGHALADGNDCIPSLQVANDGNVLFQGGAKFGTSALCDPTAEGTIRYNVSAKRMEFCNGEVWGMMGGSAGCSINFPAVANADLDTFYDTTDAIYSGTTATASVAGATAATIRRNGGNTGISSGVTINQGNSVGIRGRSAPLFNQTATFTLDIGAYTACWQLITKQQDVTPNAFIFTNLTNQEINTLVTSNSVTVTSFDGPLTVSVSGQGSPQLSVGGGGWGASASINPGDTLRVRMTTSSQYETANVASVSIGTYATAWSVSTRPSWTYSYTAWSGWSGCSASCGQHSTESRERSCLRSDGATVDCSFCGGSCSEGQTCWGECADDGGSGDDNGDW